MTTDVQWPVVLAAVAEQPIAAARQRTTFARVATEIRPLLERAWTLIEANPGLRTDGQNVAIYWDDTGQGCIELGVQVVRPFAPTEAVVCSATPAGTVATATHFGPYSGLQGPHRAIRRWCQENGRRLAGPFWEIYGEHEEDPARLRTDVLYLLEEVSAGRGAP
jgi:effector-binding domain-containing protein